MKKRHTLCHAWTVKTCQLQGNRINVLVCCIHNKINSKESSHNFKNIVNTMWKEQRRLESNELD